MPRKLKYIVDSVARVLCLYKNMKMRVDWTKVNDRKIVDFCQHWKIKSDINYIPKSTDSVEFLCKKTIYHIACVFQQNKLDKKYVDEFGCILLCYYLMCNCNIEYGNMVDLPEILTDKLKQYHSICCDPNISTIIYTNLVKSIFRL